MVPVQQNPVKMQMIAFQLQLWPNSPTGEVDGDELWIVLDTAHNAVLDLSHICWVRPYSQLLSRWKNIPMSWCNYGHLYQFDVVDSWNRTFLWSGLRIMVGGSSRYVVACVSCWKLNWTSASRPELFFITSLSVFSGYFFSLYLHRYVNAWTGNNTLSQPLPSFFLSPVSGLATE